MRVNVSKYREITALASPIAGIQLAQVALTSTDLIMMGLLGVKAVAAGGLAILLYNQLRTMCVGMVTGIGNLIAGAASSGEKRTGTDELDTDARSEIRELVRSAMLVATLIAIVGALILVGLALSLQWLGQKPDVLDLARPMMFALSIGLLPMVLLNVLRQYAVGMRRPGSLLAVTIVSVAVNAGMNGVFIYGWLGAPKLGLAGIGLSTTFVQFFTFFAFLWMVRRDDKLAPLVSFNIFRPNRGVVTHIVKHGTPICFTYGSEAAITSIATLMMGSFGPVMLAASNIANQLAYIIYQINIGLSQGTSILVSRALGHDRIHDVRHIARRTFTLSWVFMAVVAVFYLVAPKVVLWPFLGDVDNPRVVAMASTLLVFAIFHQYSKGTQNIFVGLLRGLGNTKAGLRNTLIGYWVIGIPVMVLCGYVFGWGGWGVWAGLCVGFGASAILLGRRFIADLTSMEQAHPAQQQTAPASAAPTR